MPEEQRVFSVTDLTRSIRGLLESTFPFVTVSGEVSNLRRPFSGHFYFTLKDTTAYIKAVLFKQQQRYLATPIEEGMQVLCRGRISVYEARGEYQLIIDTVEPYGTGSLQIAFDTLKRKLANEGLFDTANKQEIPLYPKRIALITSPSGAAVHDFLSTARKRFPMIPIDLFPVRVQGDGSSQEISQAIEKANKHNDIEVIVLCRGGGSIEDLWSFNEENVARAIFTSKIPVVSGIGHEIDYTIADFVADLRVVTPTAAAEAILPDRQRVVSTLLVQKRRLLRIMQQLLNNNTLRLANLRSRLRAPSTLMDSYSLRLDHSVAQLSRAIQRHLDLAYFKIKQLQTTMREKSPQQNLQNNQHQLLMLTDRLHSSITDDIKNRVGRIQSLLAVLQALNPHTVLQRGYALVYINNVLIKSSDEVSLNDQLNITLAKGAVHARVTSKD